MENNYIIYAHRRNDNGNIFYIGCTKDKYRPTVKRQRTKYWDDVVMEANGRYVEIIKTGLNKDDALELEEFLIRECRNELVNKIYNNYKNVNYGRVYSDKERVRFIEKNTQKKKVIDISTNKIYDCVRYAAKDKGINRSTLTSRLNGAMKNNTTLRYL